MKAFFIPPIHNWLHEILPECYGFEEIIIVRELKAFYCKLDCWLFCQVKKIFYKVLGRYVNFFIYVNLFHSYIYLSITFKYSYAAHNLASNFKEAKMCPDSNLNYFDRIHFSLWCISFDIITYAKTLSLPSAAEHYLFYIPLDAQIYSGNLSRPIIITAPHWWAV
jgi:hypothetical protein